MANLGKLWFELGMRDKTDKDIAEIRKGVEKRLKALNVDIGLNGKSISNSIENALRGQQFKIDVIVDKANATRAVQEALSRAGYSMNVTPSDVRAKRIEEINARIARANEKQELTIQKLQEQLRRLRGEYNQANASGKRYGDSLGGITKNLRTQFNLAVQLRNQIANIYSVYAAERFLTSVIEIGGQFQQQRVALQTMFQDAQKADILFGQIKELAVESPFEFKELAGYTKQLAAFNIPYEEMYDTTRRLADISAGVGVDMGRIILAYGQVRSAEFLKGTELRQFTEAGIPLLQQLADKFTELEGRVVSVGEVFDKISTRQVSFQMVKDVLWDLTNEGGQFYNMQGALADTLAGKLSNLRDAYDVMLADIAQSNNSLLGEGLDKITELMQKWDEYSKVILVTVGTLGTYRVALLLATAAQNLFGKSLVVTKLMNFLKATQMLTRATQAQIIASKGLSVVLNGIKANPIVAIASALAAAAGTFLMLHNSAKTTDEVVTDLNESLGNLQKSFEDLSNTDKMIDEYEELSSKQKRTKEESERLSKITDSLKSRFGGAAMELNKYNDSLELSIVKMREFTEEQRNVRKSVAESNLKNAQEREKQLKDELDGLYKQLRAGANMVPVNMPSSAGSFTFASGNSEEDLERINEQIVKTEDELAQLKPSIQEYQMELKALGIASKDASKDLDDSFTDWQKAINEFVKGNELLIGLSPKALEEQYPDWLKRYKQELSDAKEELENKKGTLGLFSKEEVNDAQKRVDALLSLAKKFNINISEEEKEKGKDPIAERFERQLDLMKSAMDAYTKYVALVGKDEAVQKVNEDSRFSGLNFNPDTYVSDLNKLLDKAGKEITRSSSLTKVRDSIQKAITDFNLDEAKVSTEKLLEEIRKTIEENTAKWNLYKDLFDITGNRELSMRFAFNVDASAMDGIYTQADYLKSELVRITGHTFDELNNLTDQELTNLLGGLDDSARSLLEQIRNTTQQESDTIIKDVLTLVQKYASADEKIKALEAQRDARIQELRNTDVYANMTPDQQQTSEDAIFKEYASQINEIREESIKLAPIWQKLFGDTANMGYQSMKKLAKEAREMVDSAKEVTDSVTGETRYELSFTDKDGSIKKTTVSLEEYMRIVKQTVGVENDLADSNPFEGLAKGIKDYKKAVEEGNTEAMADSLAFTGRMANECAQMIAGVTDAWSGMFDALGNEGAADALSFAGDMLGELGNLAQGLTSGNPIEMATSALSFIPNIISKIAGFHDKKLDRAIKKSQVEVQKLQNAYTNLQTVIERQLGEATEQQTDDLIENLRKQRDELENQRQAEEDKKKTDASKIEDYNQQIAELDDQINYFYEDLTNELYDIDLKDWAGSIADSLVNAFAAGEDAAAAFDQTVADIMKDVIKNVLQMQYIEPAMNSLRNYLFGEDGMGGILGDGSMSNEDMAGLVGQLSGLSDIIGQSQQIWEYLNEAAEKAGISLTEETGEDNQSKSGLSSSIQGVTEDTANLLGSYLNAIRQDVSVQRNVMENIGSNLLPTISITAQAQLQQLNAIAANTLANANAAKEIRELFAGVITTGSGGKAIRIK